MKTQRRDSSLSVARRTSPLRLAGIVVPGHVRDALHVRPTDETTLKAELAALARRLAVQADARSVGLADDLVTLVSTVLGRAPVEQGAFALRLFVTCVPYFDRIGRLDVLRRLAEQVGTWADQWPDPRMRRCAHLFAASVHLQVDDARRAWHHAERAYDFSAGCDAASGRFGTLVLAVSILDDMGLLDDAKTLALQLLEFPDVDASLDALHLVNAVNGLSLCHRLDDLASSGRFHSFAVIKAASLASVRLDPLAARFEAASALHLVRSGSARSAARQLDRVLARRTTHDEPLVEALLRSAQAEVYAALDDRERCGAALEALKQLMPLFHPASAFHRDLLKTIIRLELRRPDDDTAVALRYLELLRERPSPVTAESAGCIEVLLRHLFDGIEDGATGPRAESDARPFIEVGTRDWAKDPWRGRRFADLAFSSTGVVPEAVALTSPEREASLRTPAFEIAENWAVVAEIAIGGTGRQCFKVGRIAAGLAAALGLSDERTMLLEMACRLRNIGDATIGSAASQAKAHDRDRAGIAIERAKAGARILSFSADAVLRSAARIALHHRAWWNGHGVPAGLGGDSIPVEARICAVADQFVSLVDPIGRRRPWPIEVALKQLRCMAGIQLDPELVEVLDRVLHDEGTRVEDPALRLNAVSWIDPLARARRQMIETLELAN